MSTYACSDLHAQYNLWEQIKNYIKPDDVLYNLGDTVDRGSCGLQILKESLAMSNIILLCGNHENFISYFGKMIIFAHSLRKTFQKYNPSFYSFWDSNGGKQTIQEFEALPLQEQINLIAAIDRLPTSTQYCNKNNNIIYLCHAGRQPLTNEIHDTGEGIIPMNNFLWDRHHLLDQYWLGSDNEYCIHGHSPVQLFESKYLPYSFEEKKDIKKPTIKFYCEEHKIDIDLGSYNSKQTCLINLDTFEEIYFEEQGEKK